jgi:hypothetical protein
MAGLVPAVSINGAPGPHKEQAGIWSGEATPFFEWL